MIRKVISFLACIALGSSAPAVAAAPFTHQRDAVVIVQCLMGHGTAFHIGGGKYVSADHVTDLPFCSINGQPIKVIKSDDSDDVSLIEGPVIKARLTLSCGRFRPNQHYIFVGYPAPNVKLELPVEATEFDHPSDGMTSFIGEAIPGMSGGPVINRDGDVVGTANKRWPARSRELKDTFLCRD